MQRTEAKMHLIEYKLAYTVMIVIVYLLGRNIPLYGIDVSAYKTVYGDADALLMQAIGGDANQYSLFALGLSPFMISFNDDHYILPECLYKGTDVASEHESNTVFPGFEYFLVSGVEPRTETKFQGDRQDAFCGKSSRSGRDDGRRHAGHLAGCQKQEIWIGRADDINLHQYC